MACALSIDLPLLERFFSLPLFLLLDEPQPRKTEGEDHHHDQNGVLYHRSCPGLMFTDQDCSSAFTRILIHIKRGTHGRTSRPSRYPNRLPYVQSVITGHPPYSPTSERRASPRVAGGSVGRMGFR